jgi:hypothetical protein
MVTFNLGGQVLCMVEAGRGAAEADVLACALEEQKSQYDRDCARVRLAEREDLPGKWISNPIARDEREVWLVVCVWIYLDGRVGYDRKAEVCDGL